MAYTTIDNPALFFNTLLWTGDGASTRSITGVGFQPDWIWVKCRSTGHDHYSWDSVRTDKKGLEPSDTSAARTPTLGSIDSDGFSFASLDSFYNANSDTYVGWNWRAGNSSGSSNSDGDVTSTVSVNQTAGFSIATVSNLNSNSFGHGLGAEPELIINKRMDDVANWRVYFKGITSGKTLFLNTTAAETTESSRISSASSTTITVVGSGNGGSGGTGTSVYYSFKSIKGYSKIGTYTGNGNADGTFVHTGFSPALVMFKRTDSTSNWIMFDQKRGLHNLNDNYLYANSNGFKQRNTYSDANTSSGTYIYMAFAEHPFVTEGTKAAGTAR
jgi:hypothetical protein